MPLGREKRGHALDGSIGFHCNHAVNGETLVERSDDVNQCSITSSSPFRAVPRPHGGPDHTITRNQYP